MLVKSLRRVYGDDIYKFFEAIQRPSSRLYVRVNKLKIGVDELIKSLKDRGFEVYRDEYVEEAIYFPVKGPNKIPSARKVVIADKQASESVLLGSHLYAPGIVKADDFSKGEEINVVTQYTGRVIAYGIAVMDYDEVIRRRRGLAIKILKSLYEAPRIRELPEFKLGYIYPQSYPAIITSRFLTPQEGDVIVDMCAAPGGKTGHLVELSNGKAAIYAFDHSKSKLQRMIEELRRLGHLNKVKIYKADSRYLDVDYSWLKPNKVLLDPPCSALGVRPKVYDKKSYSEVINNVNYQWQFMKVALGIVRKGGLVLYSTCTVTCEENEEIIERAIRKLRAEPIRIDFPRASRGVCGLEVDDYVIRFHPHVHDTTGYFIALIKKS